MERYSKDNTKCYTQNFNPGLTLIGPPGTGAGPGEMYYLVISLDEFGLGPAYHVDILGFFKLLFA